MAIQCWRSVTCFERGKTVRTSTLPENWYLQLSMGNALSTANHLTIEQIENGTRSLTQAPGVSESYTVPQSAIGPVVELRATP